MATLENGSTRISCCILCTSPVQSLCERACFVAAVVVTVNKLLFCDRFDGDSQFLSDFVASMALDWCTEDGDFSVAFVFIGTFAILTAAAAIDADVNGAIGTMVLSRTKSISSSNGKSPELLSLPVSVCDRFVDVKCESNSVSTFMLPQNSSSSNNLR